MHCYQLLSSRYMRVDHLFSLWRRLTRSHITNPRRRQVIIPFTIYQPSSATVQNCESLIPTSNEILTLPFIGSKKNIMHSTARHRIIAPPFVRSQLNIHNWADLKDEGGSEPIASAQAVMQPEVFKMLYGHGYSPKPVPSWRKSPQIRASRKAEFRPMEAGMVAEIRPLPESVRSLLQPGCQLFRPQQIAHYNRMLKWDGKLVSGVDNRSARSTKPGRLVHKFDSLCALATSKAGRLLLLQDHHLSHVFYALCYDPGHTFYNELLNMYERRWFVVSKSYGKQIGVDHKTA